MPAITFASRLPNSSSFALRGVDSSAGSDMAARILPIAVFPPVDTTTPRALPATTRVPENSMHVMSYSRKMQKQAGVQWARGEREG
eukprot:240401-Chlamydomonas_euryale.AAC.9